jgi:hypothetical protein
VAKKQSGFTFLSSLSRPRQADEISTVEPATDATPGNLASPKSHLVSRSTGIKATVS